MKSCTNRRALLRITQSTVGFAVLLGACSAGTSKNEPFGQGNGGSAGQSGSNQGGAGNGGAATSGAGGGAGSSFAGAGGNRGGAGGSDSTGGNSGAGGGAGAGGVAGNAAAGSGGGGESGTGGMGGSVAGGMGGSGGGVSTGHCSETLPPMSDYSQNGPYATTTMDGTGPDGKYTVYQPSMLGQNGFKHPVAMWGNGITTTPQLYPGLLGAVASNGIVVIASDSTSVTAQNMTDGLDWMIQQNAMSGPYQDKLDTSCLISIGYSLGGGAAVTAGSHADVVVNVSFHGLTGASGSLHGPLLLFTSTMDTFVSASQFVTPTFNASAVQTFYATLTGAGDNGHLTPIGDAGPERAPAIAWLRLWVYGDQGGKNYFYGDDCILCKDPWGMPQRKNWQ